MELSNQATITLVRVMKEKNENKQLGFVGF